MNDPEISDYLQWTCSTHSWPEIFWCCYTKALRRSDFLVFSILLLKANVFVYVVVVAVFLICKILRYWYTLVQTCDLLSEISAFVTCHLNFSFTVTWFRFWAVLLFLFPVLCVYQEYFLCFWYSSMYYCNVVWHEYLSCFFYNFSNFRLVFVGKFFLVVTHWVWVDRISHHLVGSTV